MRLCGQKIEKKGQASKKFAEFDKGDPRFQHAHFLIEYGGRLGLFAGVPCHLMDLSDQTYKRCVTRIDSNPF